MTMKPNFFKCALLSLSTVAIFLVVENIVSVSGMNKDLHDLPCKELVVESVKMAMKEVSKCTKKLNFKTKEEKKEKASCIMKCVAINIKMLTEDGKIDEKLVLQFVDDWVPERFHDHAYEVVADCMHHAGNVDPTEPTCKSYDPIFKCVTESATKFAKMCNDANKK